MPPKQELLEILACPACRGDISFDEQRNVLSCRVCHRQYPIRDDIPVMLVEEATLPEQDHP